MKREFFIRMFAVVLMGGLLCSGVGCRKDPEEPAGAETTVTSGEVTEENLFADLPQGSYSYEPFTVLNNISNYAITTFVPEDISTPVNSAIFTRNQFVEENLQIAIEVDELSYNENKELIERLVISDMDGVNKYDICYNESWAQAILAQRGIYKSVNEYSGYLNLNKPWWYRQVMDDLSVCGNLFYVLGDMQLMWNESIWCLAFNFDTLNSHGIQVPYENVQNNTWTFETFYKISKDTHHEGEAPNHYGVASHITFASAMVCAADIRLCMQDEEEGLKLAPLDTHFTDVYDYVMEAFFSSNGFNEQNYIRTAYDSESFTSGKFPSKEGQGAFQNGNATFLGGTLGDMRTYVAGKEIPYGIVPLPKYTSDQKQYISYVYEGGALCGIPVNIGSEERLQRICTVMEWLGAASYQTVRPVYYDVILQGRIANDPIAAKMLDIVFGVTDEGITRLELDNIFRLGSATILQRRISDNKGVVSGIKTNMPLISGKMAKVLEVFGEKN